MSFVEGLLVGIGALVLIVLCAILMGWVTMLCWNDIMPYLFDWKTISYWQGVELNILFGILIKSSQTNNNKS